MKRKEKPGDIWKFSLTLGVILNVVGGLRLYHGAPFAYPLMGIGIAAAILGLALPFVMRPVYKGGMFVADKISWVMTRLVLTLLFFLVFTPYGLLFRIAGKDLLDRKLHPEKTSYWNRFDDAPYDPKRTERMF